MQPRNKQILLTLVFLGLVVGGVDAFVCPDSDVVFDDDVIVETTDATPNYPANDTSISSPVDFSIKFETCHIYPANFYPKFFEIQARQNGVLKYNNITDVQGQLGNTTLNYTLNMADGVYNWSVNVTQYKFYVGPSITHSYELPSNTFQYLLTITTTSNIGSDTGGQCLTPFGYRFSHEAEAAEDHVVVTLPSEYCVNVKCENTHIIGGDYYHYGNNQLVANTTNQKAFTVYIGGFNYNYSVTTRTPTPDKTITFSSGINNFTQQGKTYWMTYTNETAGETLDLQGATTLVQKVFCDSYSPDTINIKTLNQNPLFLSSREQPTFEAIQDNVFNRVFETYQNTENISLYLPMNTTTYETIDYQLQDYTGQFYNSYLKIITNVNGSLVTVYQKQWYNSLIDDVDLVNQTDYQYVLYTPTATRIIKWDYVDGNGDRVISITDPTSTPADNSREGVIIGLTSSYSGSSVGLTYNITDGLANNISFTVYNYTGDGYQEMDSTTVADPSTGTITVTVPDQNTTYWVTCAVDHQTYGVIKIGEYLRPSKTEIRFPMYGSWGLPDSILGITKNSWYTAVSMFLITAGAFSFSGSVGVGGLITVAVIGATKWMGWFPEMTWGLYSALMVMAVSYALVEKRRRQI